MNALLREDLLTGVKDALNEDAPDLARKVSELLKRPPAAKSTGVRGQTIFDTYTVEMSPFEAQMVMDVLAVVEAEQGATKTFNDRQINFLVESWRKVMADLNRPTVGAGHHQTCHAATTRAQPDDR